MISPDSQPCPICGSLESLDRPVALPEGGWQLVCRADHGPHVFDLDSGGRVVDFPEELAADLAIFDDLRELVTIEFQRIEYGIVEHMYGTNHRAKYDRLIEVYGHGAKTPTTYTASSFIAGVLGRLEVLGDLSSAIGLATGYWSQNIAVSYWCPAGAEPIARKTWEEFAAEREINPMSWPLLGSTRAQRYWRGEFLELAAGDPVEDVPTTGWDGSRESLLDSVYKIAVSQQGGHGEGER
jgi:hypothetical protein